MILYLLIKKTNTLNHGIIICSKSPGFSVVIYFHNVLYQREHIVINGKADSTSIKTCETAEINPNGAEMEQNGVCNIPPEN